MWIALPSAKLSGNWPFVTGTLPVSPSRVAVALPMHGMLNVPVLDWLLREPAKTYRFLPSHLTIPRIGALTDQLDVTLGLFSTGASPLICASTCWTVGRTASPHESTSS